MVLGGQGSAPRSGQPHFIARCQYPSLFKPRRSFCKKDMEIRSIRDSDCLARAKASSPQDGALLSTRDRALMLAARCDRNQATLVEWHVKIKLFIPRGKSWRTRRDPHLSEMDR